MLQGTAADTLLRNWYDSTTVANIGLFKNVADSIDANPQQAKEVNESITPDNHAEENEKAVNAIYIETWAVDSFELTPEQYDILYAIAEKTESSLATAQARTILRQVFNESWEEEEDASVRYMNAVAMAENATDKKQESITPQLLLQPNPAKESVKITYYIPSETTASAFQITDVLGRVRFSIDIPPGGNYFVFPLKNLDEGLYVCKIAGKNISLTKKLVVIK